jgi:hypothetical protein
MTVTKELLAQHATQICAALIVRSSTGVAGTALPTTDYLVTTSIGIAKAILDEAEKHFPKGTSSFGG